MMKTVGFFSSAFLLLFLFSCKTAPPEAPVARAVEEPENRQANLQPSREKDLEEIESLILTMNDIIARKDFHAWKSYLSRGYIDFLRSEKGLEELNNYPQMKNHGIVLKGIRDYFEWVVVPSRQHAQVVSIVFLNYNEVVAYSMFGNEQVKLYELERVNSRWRIALWKKYQDSSDTEESLLL